MLNYIEIILSYNNKKTNDVFSTTFILYTIIWARGHLSIIKLHTNLRLRPLYQKIAIAWNEKYNKKKRITKIPGDPFIIYYSRFSNGEGWLSNCFINYYWYFSDKNVAPKDFYSPFSTSFYCKCLNLISEFRFFFSFINKRDSLSVCKHNKCGIYIEALCK